VSDTMGTTVKFTAFGAACLLCLGWLVTMIGNVSWFASRSGYEAVLSDVGGLLVDDAVEIAGVEVGKVSAIDVERGDAVVRFEVDDEIRLGDETVVRVRWKNALGSRLLELDTAGGSEVEPGHRFGLEQTRPPADLDTFLARANPMLQAIDVELSNELMRELGDVLDGREAEVQRLVRDAAEVLDVVASRDEAVNSALRDGARIASAYAERRETLERLLADAADLGEGLSERTDVLVDAVTALAEAQGELEGLVDDNDATIRALLADVEQLTGILNAQHDDVQRVLETTGPAVVQYHRISRWGEWFNIRPPVISVGEREVASERGGHLPPRETGEADGAEPARAETGPPWSHLLGAPAGGER
jgi:phospholipid/cholesterol/gamma-HCH transport system substrate-binding protein